MILRSSLTSILGHVGCRSPYFGLTCWATTVTVCLDGLFCFFVLFFSNFLAEQTFFFWTEWMDEWRVNDWFNENKKNILCPLITLVCGWVSETSIHHTRDEPPCLRADCDDWHLAIWVTFLYVLMAIMQPNSRTTVCALRLWPHL